MKVEDKDESERKINFISLEIVDIRDIKNTRDDATLLLDVTNLKIILYNFYKERSTR